MDQVMLEEKRRITYLEVIIPLFYILNQYKVGSISLGLICILVAIFVCGVQYKRFYVYKPLLLLFGFMLLHDIIRTFITGFAVNTWIERTIYLVFLACIPGRVNKENLYKVWKIIGVIAMAGLVYQAFQVYALGQNVSVIRIIPFLNMASNSASVYGRPHSIFMEPAAYSTWILPLLCMSLSKRDNIWAIIISLTVLLSTSSTGIIMVGIAWLYFSLFGVGENGKRSNSVILISILIIGIGIFSNTDLFSAAFQKLTNISLSNTSNNVRLMLGFMLFAGLPFVYKITGIPYLSVESYMRSGKVNLGAYGLSLNVSYLGFVNALGNCLLTYGVLGAFFYVRNFWRLFLESDRAGKCYVILCFASIFGQSVFWNSLFVTQFAVMLSNAEEPECKIFTFGREY